MKGYRTLANHILDAVVKIEGYTQDMTKDHFLKNFLVQDAVIRNLEVIGEAARTISPEIKDKFPLVPWRKINAMRNKLIHEYSGVDIETVWNVVEFDLPELKRHVMSLLNSENP